MSSTPNFEQLTVNIQMIEGDNQIVNACVQIPGYFPGRRILFAMPAELCSWPGVTEIAGKFAVSLVGKWLSHHLPGVIVETKIVDMDVGDLGPKDFEPPSGTRSS